LQLVWLWLTHWPAQQSWPAPHTLPHLPQLLMSEERSAQAAPQQLSEPEHGGDPLPQTQMFPVELGMQVLLLVQVQPDETHAPVTHIWPGAQEVLQSPQCVGSPERSKQPSAQQMVPPRHAPPPLQLQTPTLQVSPVAQRLSQPPQLLVSMLVFLQLTPQHSMPGPGSQPPPPPQLQALCAQVSLVTQAWPQLPQSAGSSLS
jgi:hypothetical protein